MKLTLTVIVSCVLCFQLRAQVSFKLSSSPGVGSNPRTVVAADVNGDGKVDFIDANSTANSLSVLTNNGNGGFVLSGTYAVGSDPESAIAADVNGDGKVDLISANLHDNTLLVLTNNGNGGFVLSGTYEVGNGPHQVIAADVNGDGKVDLISANSFGNSISVLTNNGTGGFTLAATLSVGHLPDSVAAADVNGDGKVDLICPNYYNNTLSVLTNNGSGGFVLSGTYAVGSGPYTVTAADVNGDGRVDLISANWGDNALSVLTNATLNPPLITSQPQGQTVAAGSPVTLSVTATNPTPLYPLYYQWVDGLGPIPGATNAAFSLNPAQTNNWDNYSVVISTVYGAVTSAVTPVIVYAPVTITSQPMSQAAPLYGPATFLVVASGFPAPLYQWAFNGTNLPGATANTLTITNVDFTNLGSYQVLIYNAYSSTNSDVAALNLSPSLVSPFTGATAIWGKNASLAVGAVGSGQLSYQWYVNGVPLEGATSATLDFSSIQFTNAGLYSVVVSSQYGTITNTAYQVVVNPAGVSLGFYPGVTINGVVGYSYIIQRSANLADTNGWVTLTNLILTQPVELWVDTNVDATSPFNSKYFYRVLPGQ